MRTALIVPFFLCWVAGPGFAQTAPPPSSLKSPGAAAPAAGGPGGTARKRLGTPDDAAADALRSCLAMWDPGTHMTRRQWDRACRRVAERLKGTALE